MTGNPLRKQKTKNRMIDERLERMNEKEKKPGRKKKNTNNASDQLATEVIALTVRVQ